MIYALIHGANGSDGISGNNDDNGIKKIMSTSNATGATPTWTDLTTPSWCDQGSSSNDFTRNQAWYDLVAAVDPNDDQVVYIGGVDVLKTTDGGTTWNQVTQWAAGCASLPNVHADIHNIQFDRNIKHRYDSRMRRRNLLYKRCRHFLHDKELWI